MPIDSCTVTKETDSANHDVFSFYHSLGKAGVHIFTIATTLRAERSGIQVPVRARDFSLLQQHPDQYWGLPCLLFDGYRGVFPLCAFVSWVGKNLLIFCLEIFQIICLFVFILPQHNAFVCFVQISEKQ
jgi:hypothetical protein